MIVDSSAVVAIANDEPEAQEFALLIEQSAETGISAPTLVELALVLREPGRDFLAAFVPRAAIDIVPFDAAQAELAAQAHRQFGRGSGSPARLNLGDCFSYALARHTGRPLLYKGDDFIHTDVESARRLTT